MKNITLAAKPFPYSELLRSVESPEVLLAAAEVGEELHRSIYLVGGPVRDFFLRCPIKDLDLVVEGEAEEVARALSHKLRGTIRARSPFGTFKIAHPGGTLDLAMARREIYPEPAALPRVSPATIAEDLARRDFTVNAMAVALSGPFRRRLLDPLEGLRDLSLGLIRVLHEDSFVDDPTRIFRAARYAVRFGWTLARETHRALKRAYEKETPEKLSPARIAGELRRILTEPDPGEVLLCLEALGLLWALGLSEPPRGGKEIWSLGRGVLKEKKLLKALILALARGKKELLCRLGFSSHEAEEYSRAWRDLSASLEDLRKASLPSQRYRILKSFPVEVIFSLCLLTPEFTPTFKEFMSMKEVKPHLSGRDLQKLFGVSPGPRLGMVLAELLHARLDGRVKTREDELALAKRLLED